MNEVRAAIRVRRRTITSMPLLPESQARMIFLYYREARGACTRRARLHPTQGESVVKKFCVLAVLLAVPCLVSAEDKKVDNVLSFKMKSLDGKEVDLS